MGNLVKHQKNKNHFPIDQVEDTRPDGNDENLETRIIYGSESLFYIKEEADHLQHYSCNTFALGLLALNFEDARKNGDGERLLCMYKVLFLLYRLDGRKKYTYYTFHMIPPPFMGCLWRYTAYRLVPP